MVFLSPARMHASCPFQPSHVKCMWPSVYTKKNTGHDHSTQRTILQAARIYRHRHLHNILDIHISLFVLYLTTVVLSTSYKKEREKKKPVY